MLAKLPFRSKLILVVSVPLAVLLIFAGFIIAGRFDAQAVASDYGKIVSPFRDLNSLARAAGDESVASEAFVREGTSNPEAKQALDDARAATDRAVAALQASAGNLDGPVSDATDAQVAELAATTGALLTQYRGAVDLGSAWIGYFQPIAHDALDAAENVVRDLEDRDLATGLSAVLDISRQQVAISDQAAVLLYVIRHSATGEVSPELAQTLGNARIDAIVAERAASAGFAATASAAQQAAFDRSAAQSPGPSPISSNAADSALPATLTATPDAYQDWYAQEQARLDTGAAAALRVVDRTAADTESQTRNETILVALLTAAAVLVALLLAYALVRAVNRPLRALTRAARDMSERRLPRLVDTLHRGGELTPDQLEELTPIKVESDDEIGELAKAFSTIQEVTVAVAQEQSELLQKGIGDLYVNLARRNQSLLDRQISRLDEMEGRVDDPRELSSLFELDHLATRMRRNAESLLVLSGAEQPRQWGSAIPVIDVVRAAAAEIADFARVTYFGFEDEIAVAGNAVADVTHLIAELLENAAAFSPPTSPVVVAGRRVERRFVITVTDEGIGMEDERVASANALLARPPAPGLALSRTLGLYVVAHLASRYGIHVQLRKAPGSGITAVIALPAAVLARPDAPNPTHAGPTPTPAVEAPAEPMVQAESAEPRSAPQPSPSHPSVTTPIAAAAAPATTAPTAAPTPPPITWSHPSGSPTAPPPPRPAAAPTPPPTAPADTPREPATASANDPLTRRTPTTAGPTNGGPGNGAPTNGASDATSAPSGLQARVPGTHLSGRPAADAPLGPPDVRPRPERVHDLLTRHERGKRDGRVRAPETAADAEPHAPNGDHGNGAPS
jgi:signal transduction histidine kinase